MRAVLGATLLLAAATASATEPAWPPTPEAADRLAQLRTVLASATSTPAERDAARAEMMRMILANPDAPRAPLPPRAAVAIPVESAVKPVDAAKAVPPAPPVTRVTPVPAAAPPITAPSSGAALVPQGPGYVDPASGRLYQPVPGGYIDPGTGRFVPKP